MEMTLTAQQVIAKVESLKRLAELDPRDFAEEGGYAHVLAREFGGSLKPTQLRKVFHALKRIDLGLKGRPAEATLDRAEVNRLIPELAYALGRQLIPRDFYNLMKACLGHQRMQTVGDFRRTMELLTAVLAYQKLNA
jgi:CRISPR-associated protein Csm2